MALVLFDLSGKVLLSGREYIGSDWFKELKQAAMDIVIRLWSKNYEQQIIATGKPMHKLENKARSRIRRIVWQAFELDGHRYRFVLLAVRNRNGKVELLRLITTLSPAKAVDYYGYRYRIESMCRHLKYNGFDLESLHVEKAYKIRMMMAALILAYYLAVIYGLKNYKQKIICKKHGAPEIMRLFLARVHSIAFCKLHRALELNHFHCYFHFKGNRKFAFIFLVYISSIQQVLFFNRQS